MNDIASCWRKFTRHPLSEIFPDMSEDEFRALLEDMKQHGYDQKQQVWLFEGQVLDGWHRQRAGVMTDKTPTYEHYKGSDPIGFVIRRNVTRRHLDVSQRGLIAGRLANATGGRPKTVGNPTVSQSAENAANNGKKTTLAQAAEQMDVDRSTAADGKNVVINGCPEIQKAVMDKVVSLSDAASVAQEPTMLQLRALKLVTKEKAKTLAEAVAILKTPKPKKKKPAAGGAAGKFDEADKEEDAPEPTIDDEIKKHNSTIESFCRALMKLVKEMPTDVWLDDMGRRDSALQKVKDACTTLRGAICHAPCPKCDGDGCAHCKETGRVTKLAYDQLV